MKTVWIGCGQITWNRSGLDERQVLAQIALAGYEGAPAGPQDNRTAAETLALYAEFDLRPAPGYLGADFWRADHEADILARAHQFAAFAQAVGCNTLYVAAGGFANYTTPRGFTRMQVAGHVHPDDAMSADEFRQFAKTLDQVGKITQGYGVAACFHNHVGSVIETKGEIDRLWDMVDHSVVFMGPDTGHLAWGGVDVVPFCREYATAIKTMHLKDIAPHVLAEGREKAWDYRTFTDHGIFTELGHGFVDFPAVVRILDGVGFAGWLIAETDVTQQATPLLSAQISRQYLTTLGF
jgi:inosose dehydratase